MNDWLIKLHFKEMTWFFLSVFNEQFRVSRDPSKPDISVKESRFNEMYVKDAKKAEKLYARFMNTNTYHNFMNSSSFSTLFN